MNLLEKTKEYIVAFDRKNLSKIFEMLDENAILFDPANSGGLVGKGNIIKMIRHC